MSCVNARAQLESSHCEVMLKIRVSAQKDRLFKRERLTPGDHCLPAFS